MYLLAESNVLQPNITSRMSSFITVSDERKISGKLLLEKEPWLEFNPSSPSVISVLDEYIYISFQSLILEMWLAVGCNL
jgi:hypothetical protein